MEEEYIIYLLDHDAVCPVCKGMMRFDGNCFLCSFGNKQKNRL